MTTPSDTVHVLHVDDDPDFADTVATFLQRVDSRFDVATAGTADDGLDRIATEEFDCIVSDYDMPGTNGIEFLRAVRDDDPELPFILYTGKGSEAVASDAIAADVTHYMQKRAGSDHFEVLANRIRKAVEAYRSQQSLAERTRRLQTLVDNVPGIVYRASAEEGWPTERVEGECEQLTGYPASALETGDVSWNEDVFHPDDIEEVRQETRDAVATDEPFEVTYRITTADGTTKWVWERGQYVHTEIGNRPVFEGFVTDVTDRKDRKQELERYRTVVEATGDPLFSLDSEGTVVFVNEAFVALTGYDRETLIGSDASTFTTQACIERGKEVIASLYFSEADRETFEMDVLTADGDRVPCENHVALLPHEEDFQGTVAVLRDISERKQRERKLERYRTVVEASGDPVYTLSADGQFTFVNDAFLEMVHYPEDDLLGAHLSSVLRQEDQFRGQDVVRSVRDQDTDRRTSELTVVRADGTHIPCEIQITPLPTGDDESFRGTVGVIRDITERKKQERTLRQERDRLDEFASIVSHDLRNPLNVAKGRVELAREECDSEHLDDVERALGRMETLIEDLLTLAREGRQVGETSPIELDRLATVCWDTVTTADADLRVETDVTIHADGNRLQQLIENLYRNAVEHGGAGVTVTVDDLGDGFYIEDDGPGIPPAKRDAVFETGHSTAEEGNGLGLNIVAQIADAHGWDVRISEGTDGGARFEISGVEFAA
jgi:PAS domain S-box-containing protein